MNKYTLIFRDENIERKYQNQKQYGQNIIIGGLGLSFILRCIMKLVNLDWLNFGINLGVVFLLCFLRINRKSNHFYKRISLIIANCGLSMFVFIYESPSNLLYSHLRGANSALTSLIIVLTGEFPEAVFQIVFIQLTKLILIILKSSEKEYEVLLGNVLIMVLLIYYLYFHHKAIRSQYLLTLVEQKWENVLENIIENQSYFIMNFIQDTYQFNILSQHNCEQYFMDQDYKQFLRQSYIEKQNLEDYLFKQIKNNFYNNSCKSSVIFVKNSISLFKLKYSIYFTTQPTILILFENIQKTQNKNINILYKKINMYNRLLLLSINQISIEKQLCLKLKHYLQLEHVMFQIEKGIYAMKIIKLTKFLMKFNQLSILNNNQSIKDLKITTLPNILTALLFIIQDFSNPIKNNEQKVQNQILVSYQYVSENQVVLIFQGKFQVQQIQFLIDMYRLQFFLILHQFDIYQDKIIKIALKQRVQIPFIKNLEQ
ncbi:unnamed protein product [Paramecium sonneborni]|uniref:Transmembrane protein n=1 Tax=Paramecium sonneborni TaxID=65129 RepID=A0A8S1QX75_9CILI|nr:unnamed protein product [Paramecium sonneborni]